ncbi:MAG: sigma-70 family RNA polymerase sigma factor, partial [Pirellula sp.]|nr:sigma-70 family RNA polymerase sigma factor [Pirellula sp.]
MGSRKTTYHSPRPELTLHSAQDPDVLDPQIYWATASDEELCDIVVQTGSRDAMEAIVRRYSPLVCKIVARWLRNSLDRDEAFQATFIILLQSIPRIRKRASLSSFVFGVAFRTSKRIRQTRLQESMRREVVELVDVAADWSDRALGPLEVLANRLQLEELDEELRLLPESLRSPIIEHYYAGRSVPQIADSMRLSVSAVEGRIKRGKQQLRNRLALKGVSVSAALSAVATIPTEVMASDVNHLVHLLFKWNPTDSTEPISTDGLINSSSLQRLIQGEMAMKWSLLQSGMVWSGAVAAITLIGLAAIPFSLSAQGTAARVTIASSEPTAQPEAIALPVSSGPVAGNVAQDSNDPFGGPSASAGKVQNAKASAVLESSDDPFANGDSGPSTTRVPNQKPPAPPKPTQWQVQGPVPSWLDSELDQEELKVANEIRSKLAKTKLKVDFNGVPLSAVVNEIAEAIGIDVFLEQRSLTDFGISMEEPITLQFKNPMTARDALSLITHRLELSYTIRNGFIVIAYQDTQRDPLRTYDLSYVLPDNSTVHELMGVIRSSVHPEVWDTGGGMATLGVFGSMLVVRANEEAHQDLE